MFPSNLEVFLKNFKSYLGTASDEEFVRHVQNNPILWDSRCQDYKGKIFCVAIINLLIEHVVMKEEK
jgi:hypothetical protein